MALKSFQLFLSQLQMAPEALKITVLHVVFDILMVHDSDFLGPGSINVSPDTSNNGRDITNLQQGQRIVDFLLHLLENEESEKVQALLCAGVSKLMLSGMITDDRVSSSKLVI